MTERLAQRLAAVKPSPSIAAKARVDALRAAGRRIIDFTVGELDLDTPDHVVQSAIAALKDGHTRYTATAGTPALRQAIAKKLSRENGLDYSPDRILVAAGAKHVIYNAFAATLNDGDEVIVPAPYWVSYPDMVALQGGVPVIVTGGAGFKLTAADLERAITPKTRWLIVNSPNNPTGAVYTRAELASIAAVLRRHPRVWVMTDEIYEHFVYEGVQHVSLLQVAPDLATRALVVNGLSKAYAMTGWRIGYGAGPKELIGAIMLLQTHSTTCASAVSQAAAVAALDGPQTFVSDAVDLYRKRRDRIVGLLSGIPGVECRSPDGAFYVFPSVAALLGTRTPDGQVLASDNDVLLYALEAAGVATVAGSSFGTPGHLRLSFATSMENIDAGCAALAAAFGSLARA